jgi:hypothetical protein
VDLIFPFVYRYLPAIVKSEKESTEEFAKRVQGIISKRLGVEATNFTVGDKKELEKKLVIAPVRQQEQRIAQRNAELQRMVAQVRFSECEICYQQNLIYLF